MLVLADREQGAYPISIATSLALEGGFGNHPDTPTGVNEFAKAKGIFINLRTLIRNILGSVDSETKYAATGEMVYNTLIAELEVIRGILNPLYTDEDAVRFYVMDYESLSKVYPKMIFKEVSTDKQRTLATTENSVLHLMKSEMKEDQQMHADVEFLDSKFKHSGIGKLLLSSFPVDLLALPRGEFSGLLESHTGVVKTRVEYYTKFKDRSKSERIPFDRAMIQIFGDSSNLFGMQTAQIRNKLKEIAEKYQWNALTTKDRVLLTVKLSKEPVLYDLVKNAY